MCGKSIILLTGHAKSGKSYTAEHLCKKYGYTEYSLAHKLKELTFQLLRLFDRNIESVDDLSNPVKKGQYRHYLQQIGNDIAKPILGDDIWVRSLCKDLTGDKIVISDIRFQYEIDYIVKALSHEYTVQVIKIECPLLDMDDPMYQHCSELDIDNIKYDYVVENNRTPRFLEDIDDIICPHDYMA